MLMPAYWPPAAGLSSLLLPQADEQAGAPHGSVPFPMNECSESES